MFFPHGRSILIKKDNQLLVKGKIVILKHSRGVTRK